MPTLYGLKTCDTCRRAAKALEAAGQTVIFRDVRDDPLPPETIARFLARFGAALLNTRSTTWRNLPASERSRPAAELLAAHPALMKRPVIKSGDLVTLGWNKEAERAHLG